MYNIGTHSKGVCEYPRTGLNVYDKRKYFSPLTTEPPSLQPCQCTEYAVGHQSDMPTFLAAKQLKLLDTFAKLRKGTIGFVMSVRTEQLGSLWTDFHEMRYLSILRKSVEKVRVSLKSDKNNGYFT